MPAPQSYPNRFRQQPPGSVNHPPAQRRPLLPPQQPPPYIQHMNPPSPQAVHGPPHPPRINPLHKEEQHLPQNSEPNIRFRQPTSNQPGPHLDNHHSPQNRVPVQKIRMDNEMGEHYPAEPPQIPPRPILFSKNPGDNHIPKIATLQMIQQRSGLDEDASKANSSPETGGKNDKDGNSTVKLFFQIIKF